MARTVTLAKLFKVAVGAHPGYPDLLGFGRREMKLSREELENYVIYQIGALQAVAKAVSLDLQHVKPHGALYNMASKSEELAKTIVEAVQRVNTKLILFAPPNSLTAKMAARKGQPVAFEAFADRAYNSDGTLVLRSQLNAVIENPQLVAKRAIQMIAEGTVKATNGKEVHLGEVHTICVHSDTPKAPELVKKLRKELLAAKIEVKSVGTFL